jgi:hypothetical protein
MVKVYDNFANDFYIPTLITLWFCRKSWYESHQWSL